MSTEMIKTTPPNPQKNNLSVLSVLCHLLAGTHMERGQGRAHARRRADPKVLERVWRMRDRGMTFSSHVGMSREKRGARNMEEKQRGKDNPEPTSN